MSPQAEEQLAVLRQITELVAAEKCDAIAVAVSNRDGTAGMAWAGPMRSIHYATSALAMGIGQIIGRTIPRLTHEEEGWRR